jgi:hypothetical protein
MPANLTPIKSSDNMLSITTFDFRKFEKMNTIHKKKINTFLSKYTASMKTKALTLLLDKDILMLGLGAVNLQNSTQPTYAVNIFEDNTIRAILVDLAKVVDSYILDSILKDINTIQVQQDIILTNERMLTSTSTLQIDMAKEKIDKTLEKIIDNINYFDFLDIAYFSFLRYLSRRTLAQNRKKLFSHVALILSENILKIVTSYNSNLTAKQKAFIQLVISYLLLSQYTDQPKQTTLKALIGSSLDEETKKLITTAKLTKYSNIMDLTFILAEVKILNITPNALTKKLNDTFGKNFSEFLFELDSLVAYLCSINHKSEIFISKYSSVNNDTKELEELVMNAKGNILYRALKG